MKPMVADRYRLDAELGSGGMAEVCLAWDIVMDRACAVKLLRVEGPGADSRRQRMRAEAEAMAALDHPHVVRVYEHGVHEGRDFIAMEYLPGGSLQDALATDGPMAPARAARLACQVLDALGAAHRAGVVHRDVKPANVLLRSADEVALCDFGIARRAAAGGTQTGMALGSVGFMAPEQRLDASRVGPAADLYAVACTVFNLVTGDTPVDLYLAPDHSPRWADVPAPLVPVLRKATAADPSDRYHDAAEMIAALRAVEGALEGMPPATRRWSTASIAAFETSDAAPESLSLEAAGRPRSVRAEDWAPQAGRPPGRLALWMGTGMVGVLTVAGLVARPMLRDLQVQLDPEVPVTEAAPAGPALEGTWFGNLDGESRVSLRLEGPLDALYGDLELGFGEHRRASKVLGRWDTMRQQVVLRELDTGLVLRMEPQGAPGLLLGTLERPEREPHGVVLAWVESAPPPE